MFASFSEMQKVNILILYLWRTATSDNDNSESIIFQRFRNYRNEIQEESSQNPNYSGKLIQQDILKGYGSFSQDV